MKFSLFLFFLLCTIIAHAQDISGDWFGSLNVPGGKLHLVFHIDKTADGFSTTMDSPDQGAKGIPVTTTTFIDSTLKLEIPAATIEYTGTFRDSVIAGTFKQSGFSFPMTLRKESLAEKETAILKRPQEPQKPFPYRATDVSFENKKAHVTLAGTLTLPERQGKYPAVILITGSGPQNRDEEIMGHKPFLVIADYLTRNGIAVLRYDDRGTAKSTGDFRAATSADFATDVESAIAFLKTQKEIDPKKIGLIGHSEGGIIAPMVASEDKSVDFIVLLAGPGLRGDQLILLQKELIEQKMNVPDSIVSEGQKIFKGAYQLITSASPNDTSLSDRVHTYLKEQLGRKANDDIINSLTASLVNPWMIYFLKLDPVPYLEKVKCPVLALNGGNDLQVPAKENLEAISTALKQGGNKHLTVKEFPGLNHLFQESKTGLPNEYGSIEQTFSPAVLEFMTHWIKGQVK